jgi:Beta protein
VEEPPVYVPIVKGKMYDILALKELAPAIRGQVMPLLEIMPLGSKGGDLEDHIVRLCSYVKKYLPLGRLYLDFRGLDPDAVVPGGINGTIFGFRLLQKLGRPVTPVYGLARNDALWKSLGEIAADFNQGFCFRLARDDLDDFALDDTWEQIIERTKEMTLSVGRTDLLIDLGSIANDYPKQLQERVLDFLGRNPETYKYRSIIVAGSSALKDVSSVEKEGTEDVPRRELDLWRSLWLDVPTELRPIFADYGVVHPDFSDVGPNRNINAKIRYTSGNVIRYFRGHGLWRPTKDYGQYRSLAAKVRNSTLYLGPSASFGDQYIDDCANHITSTPGAPNTWVRADMNSHISHTAMQIAQVMVELEGVAATLA